VTRASQAINKTYKTVDTRSLAITTIMTSFGHNIPSTHLQHHQLRPEYLQPKEHHLYGCGGLPHSYRWNYGRFGFINNIYIFINLLHIKIYIFSVSRILTSDRLYSQYLNDSKLNRKAPLKIQYIVLISILTNDHTR
jgi:hypothetical protein